MSLKIQSISSNNYKYKPYSQNFTGALFAKTNEAIIKSKEKEIEKTSKSLLNQLKKISKQINLFNLSYAIESNSKKAANFRDTFGIKQEKHILTYEAKDIGLKGILKNSYLIESTAASELFENDIIKNELKFSKDLRIYHLINEKIKDSTKIVKDLKKAWESNNREKFNQLLEKYNSFNKIYKLEIKKRKKTLL